ncbi:AfsA-related hotdog domain-containing protein [Xenorhabdus doucetiae]|uniref:A-factor biosynthesis hotdog protein n=1 Tax=Xenorhabdus doucetiae TaxID=351671 RepID=A0A068QUR5_9GAMM|nr:AfsA-related hotdog domain-containing protein [Xenorhabdus doucetiae]TYP02230.1 A-factor biosynthesis hotdog protein [Xenorhabdus doucetiae]CDG18386.1 protein of unknown function [Xenorhabdus doucetiae]
MADIVVVGDRFAEFSENDNVFTFTQALKFLSSAKCENDYQVIFGQGLSKENIEEFKNSLCHGDTRKTLPPHQTHLLKETTRNTHKHKAENILISETIKIGESSYQCHLLIDDDCAEMADHITGQHIQGMVLLEACRQMVNSVSERFLIKTGSEKSFVLHSMNSEFKEYLFPIASSMEMTIRHFRRGLKGDFTTECIIAVIQNSTVCLCVTVKFSAIDKGYLSLIERQMAAESLSHLY